MSTEFRGHPSLGYEVSLVIVTSRRQNLKTFMVVGTLFLGTDYFFCHGTDSSEKHFLDMELELNAPSPLQNVGYSTVVQHNIEAAPCTIFTLQTSFKRLWGGGGG